MRIENKVIDPLSPYSRALKKIEESGIRPTKQRRILAKLIFEKGDRHISAENLFDEVKNENRKISMATIYNTLKQFTSLGLIREIVVDQNKSLYCNNNKSHYHLYIEEVLKNYYLHEIGRRNELHVLFYYSEIYNLINLYFVNFLLLMYIYQKF